MSNGYVVYDGMAVPHWVDPGYMTPGMSPTPVSQLASVQSNGGNVTNTLTLNQTATGLAEVASLHNSLLTTNLLISSGTGSDPNAQQPTTTVRRPWLEAPEGAVPFDPQISIALPGVGTTATIVTLTVPDGYDGVINAYSWNFTGGGFVQGSGDLVVQVLRNGAAVRNYDNILVEKGSIQQPRNISPLRIYSGQVISLVINHAANALLNGNIIGCFSGYFYPSAS